MFNFGPTFIWTFVNLVVMYLILKKILFKPVMKIMEDRENSIKRQIDDADQLQKEAKNYKIKYQDKLSNAEQDGEVIIKNAKIKAQKECEELIDKTRKEVDNMMLKAKNEIEQDRLKMIKDIRKQVVELAILAASKIMKVNLNNETNKKVVQNFLDEEGVS